MSYLVSLQLEIIEGMPDLGVTSYWTDTEGNVVFNPNTAKEKRKTSVTGAQTPKCKESAATAPTKKVEDKRGSDSRKLETGKIADDVPAESKSLESDETVEERTNPPEEQLTAANSDVPVQPAETVEELEKAQNL